MSFFVCRKVCLKEKAKRPPYIIYVLFCPRNHRRQTAATTSAAWRTNGETTTPHLPSANQPCPRHIFLFSFSLFLFCPDFHSHLTSVARKWDCKRGKYFKTHKQLFAENLFPNFVIEMLQWRNGDNFAIAIDPAVKKQVANPSLENC